MTTLFVFQTAKKGSSESACHWEQNGVIDVENVSSSITELVTSRYITGEGTE
jgi:hypothetical protein